MRSAFARVATQSTPASTSSEEQPSLWKQTKQLVSDVPSGFGKGAAETAGTIANVIHKTTGLPINPEFTEQQKHTGAASAR
jgi:hypothetical protein